MCETSTEPSTCGHQGLQYNSQADEEQGSREAEAFPGEQHVVGKHLYRALSSFVFNPEFKNVVEMFFKEDNGLPVHIKGGSTDMLLYRITMTITIVGRKRQHIIQISKSSLHLSVHYC